MSTFTKVKTMAGDTAYRADVTNTDGRKLRFYVHRTFAPYGETVDKFSTWTVSVKELTVTAGVEHTLDMPVLAEITVESLAEARRTLTRFVTDTTRDSDTSGRLRQAWHDQIIDAIRDGATIH